MTEKQMHTPDVHEQARLQQAPGSWSKHVMPSALQVAGAKVVVVVDTTFNVEVLVLVEISSNVVVTMDSTVFVVLGTTTTVSTTLVLAIVGK